ncbi:hypothetical protein VBD025_15840 [Virgibacillus flavescens]|uniref:hypothetical protein n=1 Tax=Virgibacillus flavescens TaxID=1611422 RepID=UPI003D33AB09
MKNIQAFAKQYNQEMNWHMDKGSSEQTKSALLGNYMRLTTEVAEVTEELRKGFNMTNTYINEGMDEEKAFEIAMDSISEDLGKELANCLAYITKFANYFEVDLEDTYFAKMEEVRDRKNRDVSLVRE